MRLRQAAWSHRRTSLKPCRFAAGISTPLHSLRSRCASRSGSAPRPSARTSVAMLNGVRSSSGSGPRCSGSSATRSATAKSDPPARAGSCERSAGKARHRYRVRRALRPKLLLSRRGSTLRRECSRPLQARSRQHASVRRSQRTTCERLGRRLSDARYVGKQAYRRCRRPPLGGQRDRDGARSRVSQAAANCGVPSHGR